MPGVCNIGPAEIRRRRRAGVVNGIATVAGLTAAVALGLPRPMRLALAVPAGLSAVGFLQARSRFCAAFGMLGVFNVGEDLGRPEPVAEAAARREDRRTAFRIVTWSAAIGVATASASMLLPRRTVGGRSSLRVVTRRRRRRGASLP